MDLSHVAVASEQRMNNHKASFLANIFIFSRHATIFCYDIPRPNLCAEDVEEEEDGTDVV